MIDIIITCSEAATHVINWDKKVWQEELENEVHTDRGLSKTEGG
jgi:hypothetical protein